MVSLSWFLGDFPNVNTEVLHLGTQFQDSQDDFGHPNNKRSLLRLCLKGHDGWVTLTVPKTSVWLVQ